MTFRNPHPSPIRRPSAAHPPPGRSRRRAVPAAAFPGVRVSQRNPLKRGKDSHGAFHSNDKEINLGGAAQALPDAIAA